MVVATLLLCGSAEFRHLGIMFRHANLAILEAIVLACGTATFVVGGLGWVITALGPLPGGLVISAERHRGRIIVRVESPDGR